MNHKYCDLNLEINTIYRKARWSFTLIVILIGCFFIVGIVWINSLHEEITALEFRIECHDTASARHLQMIEGLRDDIIKLKDKDIRLAEDVEGLKRADGYFTREMVIIKERLTWIDHRIEEFNNACDYHNFDVVFEMLTSFNSRINDLVRSYCELYNYAHKNPTLCPSFQRRRCPSRR